MSEDSTYLPTSNLPYSRFTRLKLKSATVADMERYRTGGFALDVAPDPNAEFRLLNLAGGPNEDPGP